MSTKPTYISKNTVIGLLSAKLGKNLHGDKRIWLMDATWQPVSDNWVFKNWDAWFKALPPELKDLRYIGGSNVKHHLPKWSAENYDCDNHALGCMVHGQVGNALKAARTNSVTRGGLLFGVVFYNAEYKPDNARSGGHAINWCITPDHQVKFYEPADRRFVELTKTELDSIWFIFAA